MPSSLSPRDLAPPAGPVAFDLLTIGPYTRAMGMTATSRSSSPLRGFQAYVEELRCLVTEAARAERSPAISDSVRAALDGQAAENLRRLVPLTALRRDGIFLTSSELARRTVRRLLPTLGPRSVILDPACGAGDLLLACVEALPTASCRHQTVRALPGRAWWSEPS